MKILFIGKVNSSLKCLKQLIKLRQNIVGVITDNKPRINSDYLDLKPFCNTKNIPSKYAKDINSKSNFKWIKKCNPDYILCIGWSRLIGKKILEKFKNRVIGFHPSLLPFNRGRHPIIWSLILRLRETGISFFIMSKKIDYGKILLQKKIRINKKENSKTLIKKIEFEIIKNLNHLINTLKKKRYSKQLFLNPKKKYNIWRKRDRNDGIIDWRMNAENINKLIEALGKPYAGASFLFNNKEVKVWKARIVRTGNQYKNYEYGKVIKVFSNKSFLVKCIDRPIKIINYYPRISIKQNDYL